MLTLLISFALLLQVIPIPTLGSDTDPTLEIPESPTLGEPPALEIPEPSAAAPSGPTEALLPIPAPITSYKPPPHLVLETEDDFGITPDFAAPPSAQPYPILQARISELEEALGDLKLYALMGLIFLLLVLLIIVRPRPASYHPIPPGRAWETDGVLAAVLDKQESQAVARLSKMLDRPTPRYPD